MQPTILLLSTILLTSAQPYLPHGLAGLLTPHLDFSKVKHKVSLNCANESQLFFTSIVKSLKILQHCTDSCPQQLYEHFFALKQLDASGKIPSGISDWVTVSEGSYNGCRELDGVKYPTDYCYLDLIPGKNSICPAVEKPDSFQIKFKLAVCIPESCSSKDVVEMFNGLTANLPVPLTACRTFCVKETAYKRAGRSWPFWLFSGFMTAMLSICTLSTILDYQSTATGYPILSCFSLLTNFKIILEHKPELPGTLKGLDFLKFFSVFWVIVGHSPLNFLVGDTIKPLIATRDYLSSHLVLDAMYSVETFFLISGVLLGYGLFKNRQAHHLLTLKSTWIVIITRRYIRLLVPLLPWLGVVAFSHHFVRGPAMASLENYLELLSERCEKTWWKIPFMTHNTWKPSESCYPISWYVASDFQFFLLAPFIIIPIVKSQGHRAIGALISISILFIFLTMWYYDLSPFFYTLHNLEKFLTYFHQQTLPRLPTFIMGILMGKYLARCGTKPGLEVLKEHSTRCWSIWIILLFLCFYGKHLAVRQGLEEQATYNPMFSATHHIIHVALWNTVVLWVIYACQFELGTPTVVFNHPFWQPLGRLTYCIYIVHWLMVYLVFNLSDRALHFVSMWKMILEVSIPTLLISLPVALVWSAIFEVPVSRMEKLVTAHRKAK